MCAPGEVIQVSVLSDGCYTWTFDDSDGEDAMDGLAATEYSTTSEGFYRRYAAFKIPSDAEDGGLLTTEFILTDHNSGEDTLGWYFSIIVDEGEEEVDEDEATTEDVTEEKSGGMSAGTYVFVLLILVIAIGGMYFAT